MALEVRPARPEEYDEAGRVTADAYREFAEGESWDRYLLQLADVEGRARVGTVLVAVEDGRILGTLTLELDRRVGGEDPPLRPDEAHLRMLGVAPDARGRGVARAMLHTAFDVARLAAKAMYEAMGFERLPDRVFPDGFVLLSYEKAIPPG